MSGALLLLGLAISAFTIGGLFDDSSDSNSSDEGDSDGDTGDTPDSGTPDVIISSEFQDLLTTARDDADLEDFEFVDGTLDVDTGDGDDIVLGGSGDDMITLGAGDDTASGGEGDDSVDLGAGDDVYGSASVATLLEAELENTDLGDDTVFGGSGADFIRDDFGSNSLSGGTGNDFIQSTDSPLEDEVTADRVDGGSGDDTFVLDQGDVVVTGSGSDNIGILLPDTEDTTVDPEVVTIEDFDIDSDMIQLGGPVEAEDLRIEVFEDGTGSTIFFNDSAVVLVFGGQELTLDDIIIAA